MEWNTQEDPREDVFATESDADREEALYLSSQDTERAWVLTNRDVWHPNPFYRGPEVPHPESDPHPEFCDPGGDTVETI